MLKRSRVFKGVLASIGIAASVAHSGAAIARDQIQIVGSSTVYPFATIVAERFGNKGAFKTPVIESTGTGGGMKLFCQGVGSNNPDISNASRAMNHPNGITARPRVLPISSR